MLFNSHYFIFVFLPITLWGFYRLGKYSHNLAALWLTVASLFFYGWWDSRFVGLLLGSIAFNYSAGYLIQKQSSPRKTILLTAIVANLALLGYFKYANFFLDTFNYLAGSAVFPIGDFFLPLGISFFTFTQTAFLIDSFQGKAKEYNFVHYTLFVTYFPHLIAGPVLHHKEMMPQFKRAATYCFNYKNLMIGSVVFSMGLFKKVVLADSLAAYVGPVFKAPNAGIEPTFIEAWLASLSYALQLYFDFSGYSDMAIGLSRMFGVILPLNFHSPYKAVNIIEFWRRWHMTLSRLLRDYLYIPLGGNRHGLLRRHINLLLTMLLGGLWHGANWTFVIWGGLHGLLLIANHAWQAFRQSLGQDTKHPLSQPAHALSVLLTFLAVTVAWVFFRADNLGSAISLVKAMLGINGFTLPEAWLIKWDGFGQWLLAQGIASSRPALIETAAFYWLPITLMIVWFSPNTQEIMMTYRPALEMPDDSRKPRYLCWRPSTAWLLASILCAVVGVLSISELSEFIYFQF